ncbi:hypothetical protein P3T76_010690 [Phytophthora citrophthora]|uniref:Uncharacterized protein n=1 Tax=Phytophthora citrophthora TaxID=4793 RepID=A0AAD9LGC7_9STRA|nr:hypothetical protein P3T76_010690 [Phytophthora citrophthora]
MDACVLFKNQWAGGSDRFNGRSERIQHSSDESAVDGLLSLMNRKRQRESSTPLPPLKRMVSGATDTESLKGDDGYEERTRRTFVDRFEKKKYTYPTITPAREDPWTVALAYFSVFRRGLQPRLEPSTRRQFELLRAATSPAMGFNSGFGSEAMIKSWKCVSLWFQDVELDVEEMKRGASGSIAAITTTSVTINERTLRNVFPHLCSNNGRYNGLAGKLLGRRIVMRGLTRFEWDAKQRCLSRVRTRSDLLDPMARLVGLDKVSLVFEKAIISPEFQWRSTTN